MTSEGLDLVPVVVDDDTYRQAYDVVANTTLWYCHHHLFDLPRRPRFDRYWRTAWDGYRAYNRAVADAVADRADEGATVLVQDYHFSLLGRMLAERRPDLRTVHFLHTPFADPNMLARPARRRARRSCSTAWPATAPAASTATGGRRGSAPASPTRACPRRRHVRGAARDRRRRRSSPRRPSPGCAAAAEALRAAVGGRRTVVRVGPHGAVEEHRAGDARLRGAAARAPRVARRGGARGHGVSRAGRGWPSISPTPPRWSTRPSGSTTSDLVGRRGRRRRVRRVDADRAARRRRPRALPRRAGHLGRAARQPRARRAQPRGQGGPAAQPQRRRAGALARSRRLGGALPRRPRRARREPLRRDGDGRGAAPALSMGAAERAGAPASLRASVTGRTSADWWADQLAAAAPAPGPSATGRTASGSGASADPPRHGGGTCCRGSGQGAQHVDRAGGAGHGEVGRVGHLGRALVVDGGDTHRADRRWPSAPSSPTAAKAGRSPMSSPKTATWRSVPACSAASAGTTVPLSTCSGGRSSSSMRPGWTAKPRVASLALGEVGDPRLRVRRVTPVQRDGQALGFDVDPGGRFGVASATTSSTAGRPAGRLLGARRARARGRRGRRARPRRANRARRGGTRSGGPRSRRPGRSATARSASSAGTPGRGRAPTGSGTMAASVPSKSRNSAPCAGSAARGRARPAAPGTASAARAPSRHVGRQAPGAAARSWPMTTITSSPDVGADWRGGADRQHLGRLHADGGGDGRGGLLLARRVVDGGGRLAGAGVGRRLHVPPSRADHGRVVGGQPVGGGGVGHDHADRGVRRTVVVVVVVPWCRRRRGGRRGRLPRRRRRGAARHRRRRGGGRAAGRPGRRRHGAGPVGHEHDASPRRRRPGSQPALSGESDDPARGRLGIHGGSSLPCAPPCARRKHLRWWCSRGCGPRRRAAALV